MAGGVLVQGNDEQPTDPWTAKMTTLPGHVSPLYPSNTRNKSMDARWIAPGQHPNDLLDGRPKFENMNGHSSLYTAEAISCGFDIQSRLFVLHTQVRADGPEWELPGSSFYIYSFPGSNLGGWRNRGNLLLSFPNVGDCMYTRDQSISTISSVSSGFSIHQLLVLGFVSRKNISLAIIKFYFIVLPASAASTDASHTHTCISPLRRSRLVA